MYVPDEPTTGLRAADVEKLVVQLSGFVALQVPEGLTASPGLEFAPIREASFVEFVLAFGVQLAQLFQVHQQTQHPFLGGWTAKNPPSA